MKFRSSAVSVFDVTLINNGGQFWNDMLIRSIFNLFRDYNQRPAFVSFANQRTAIKELHSELFLIIPITTFFRRRQFNSETAK